MTASIITDQASLILTALIILGITVILKIITTVTLLIMADRQKKSIAILLDHPFFKKERINKTHVVRNPDDS